MSEWSLSSTQTLPWHRSSIARIEQLLAQQRLPSGLGLTCEDGWGLTNYLNQAALMLLDVSLDQTAAQLAHPDLRWVVADGAAIKVEQIRQLVDFSVGTPSLAARKVAAIMDAHLMNQAAANALLKTLEEPPPNTHILLATSKWGALLPTIRSRLQQFYAPPDQSSADAWLQNQGVAADQLCLAEFGRAPLSIFAARQRDEVSIVEWLSESRRGELSRSVDTLLDMDVVSALARWYRVLLFHLQAPCVDGLEAPAAQVLRFTEVLLNIRHQLETSNAANAKLLVEHLVLDWRKLCRGARTH